jgi:hypothetical protein
MTRGKRNFDMKRTELFSTIGFCLLLLFEQGCAFGQGGGRGELVERWENSLQGLKIRVTEYKEANPVYLTHFFYVFESSHAASGDWHEIMSVTNDDDVPLPRDQIRALNDQIAYVFMNEKYAVTTDGGRSWNVWQAIPENLSKLQFAANIRDVRINIDGTGIMHLRSLRSGQITTLTVSTKDYGHHWNFE